MSRTPISCYQHDLKAGGLIPDPAQALAVEKLQRVFDDLQAQRKAAKSVPGVIKNLLRIKRSSPVLGLYLWGGVGIGKTYLMDVFYHCLPDDRKMRSHFHHFMKDIHDKMKLLKGQAEPLALIAKELASKIDVLCFDEFFVSDIGDAMILGNLLKALFKEGITLIATSNVVPDKLYYNGLQRELFLPAIKLLQTHTEIFHVDTTEDYRLRELKRTGVFFTPLGLTTDQKMLAMFQRMVRTDVEEAKVLNIEGREIQSLRCSSYIAWFDFKDLCTIPRSQVDYLIIAETYPTVFVSNIPEIAANQDNSITYLINLIDVFYDLNVKLILSAEKRPEELYTAGRKVFEYQRTLSRLFEMQSEEYLARPHGRS